jgi:hypothetical protein
MKAIIYNFDTRAGDSFSEPIATFDDEKLIDAVLLRDALEEDAKLRMGGQGAYFTINEYTPLPHNPKSITDIIGKQEDRDGEGW